MLIAELEEKIKNEEFDVMTNLDGCSD